MSSTGRAKFSLKLNALPNVGSPLIHDAKAEALKTLSNMWFHLNAQSVTSACAVCTVAGRATVEASFSFSVSPPSKLRILWRKVDEHGEVKAHHLYMYNSLNQVTLWL